MKTKKPSAIVYNWDRKGVFEIQSEIYCEENLIDYVTIYSLNDIDNLIKDYSKYQPDLIISFGNRIVLDSKILNLRYINYDKIINDVELANEIVKRGTFINCENPKPQFSIFTPTYNIGERILRTYDSILNQSFTDWEWIVVDDSTDDITWNILLELKEKDYRVKPYRIFPLSGGNIGLVKNRAASLCDGDWLVELDHDDVLTKQCLEVSNDAILQYPDAGFLYSDVCEMFEDGGMKTYDHDFSGNWYGRNDNFFDFGYAGHSWTNVDGKDLIAHWYPDINPLTIRFNISMPDHVRMWERKKYLEIGGHNKNLPIADDLEIIIRTFLNTKIIHVKQVLYIQYNNKNTTVDNNAIDINRRARLVRDYYDKKIHEKIIKMGKHDWNWVENENCSQKFQNHIFIKKFHSEEEILNYIYK